MKMNICTALSANLKKLSISSLSRIGISILCAYSMVSHADYRQVVEEDFWTEVYPNGGLTFFCQSAFSKPSPVLNVGHIYPSNWISEHLGCRSERTCLRTNPEYETIISDMHNMVPIEAYHYFKIKGSVFGSLDTTLEANECGVRKRLHLINPPDAIKGDVARIHFYMHHKYQLPLNSNYAFMKEWHKSDPPSADEITKNERIKKAQGNENIFITQPELVDTLDF